MGAWGKESFIVHQSYIGPKGKIFSGTLSPDGKYVVIIDKSQTLRVWRYSNGRPLKAIKTGTHRPLVGIFHPSRNLYFTGGQDGKIEVWDIARGIKVQSLSGQAGPVEALAISKDGELLLSGGRDKLILLWRLDRYKVSKKITEISGQVVSLDFHPNNKTIAWANGAGEVKVWDTDAGVLLGAHKLHGRFVSQVLFHPQGQHIASAGADNSVIFWDYKTKKTAKKIEGHQKPVTGISFNLRGEEMVSCSLDGTIKVWDLRKDKVTEDLNLVEKPVTGCIYGNNAKSILGVFENTYVRGWNLGENGFVASLDGHKKAIAALDTSKTGYFLLSLSIDNQLKLWDLQSSRLVKDIVLPPEHKVESLRFSPDGSQFATGGNNGDTKIWSRSSGKVLVELSGHKGKITSLDFSPTEKFLVTAGADKQLILWDLTTKRPVFQREIHNGQINMVRYSPDGDWIGTGSADKTAKVFRAFDQQMMYTFSDAERGIRAIAFSPLKDYFATASDDNTLRLYEMGNGQAKEPLKGHEFIISDIAFSPNGKALVSASRDKTVRLWDVRGSKFIRTLIGQEDQITAISESPDGKFLSIGNQNGSISLIRLPKDIFEGKGVLPSEKEAEEVPLVVPTGPEASAEENQEPEKPPAREYSDKDIMEEQAGNSRDTVFDAPVVAVDEELLALKARLNSLLMEKNVCKLHDDIESVALKVLARSPEDQAAYYGLIQVYGLNQDLQAVFLLAKIGAAAKLDQETYKFANPDTVNLFFKTWVDSVFNLSVAEGAEVNLEFIDCNNDIQKGSMPKNLLYFELPVETVETLINNGVSLDFRAFADLGRQSDTFRNRLFGLVEAVDAGETRIDTAILGQYAPKTHESGFGTLKLDMTGVEQFSTGTKRVTFLVKRQSKNWQTFMTDTDRKKTLILLKGEYYLKVNDRVKSAFEVKAGEEITEKIQ
ncbi:MAG: hypothetical protein A2600_03955 [Candidatus Lambdaproteobacteria bacterium RIFOXYD1_FULL_56_27]|uniref:Uncharacterized protein n=1 Tax=Candidatus Lambdaproteobacteria bacterium RIFOXYD2_FULL_56_26 TaxID=1817773 RepID=A0A1F6H3G7_9PROT|nr:MAG: hypothetical protein A2426_01755 [Candidatus Lambdaproteobacteria bacterium RIFOXYC1_FULL_56_13]OGH04912.1 MAG: hypothetical protein A2557_08020 [Candidatus Lambdaproteobacteria bacterium RIFOXYD2_FULL_56_26]OGH09376.1 MAG: hypothetical protein A2600_03955 [Candidatus Lambdaproteobacteria bacterium RIFOXYD1_FULL_56_27]